MASRLLGRYRHHPLTFMRHQSGFSSYPSPPPTPSRPWLRLTSLSAIAFMTTSLLGYYGYHICNGSRWSSTISLDVARSPKIQLAVGAACEPKHKFPDRSGIDCGDDAYITAHQGHRVLLAVADGVGGARESGADPGKYAWSLLGGLARLFSKEDAVFEAQHVLAEGYEQAIESAEHRKASSTVCLAEIDTVAETLHLHNIGDSGCRVIRDGKVVYQSPIGQYDFNFPHQLSVVDRDSCASVRQFARDTVKHYTTSEMVSLKPGDLLILATDGLFDNIYEDRMLAWIEEHDRLDIKTMASQLVSHIKRESEKKHGDSPFSQAARAKHLKWRGGKPDDITLIMVKIMAYPTSD